ncbi:MAG: FG-GAP-like repeat-containing protein [Cyclobacteriaceae bacterium]
MIIRTAILTLLVSANLFSLAQSIFSNVAEERGVRIRHMRVKPEIEWGTGAAWFDCDKDGDLDLYVANQSNPANLFRNELMETGSANFTDITPQADFISYEGGGVSIADYDNDGDSDLYLANAGSDYLLANDGQCNFTDITAVAFPDESELVPEKGTGAAWGDINDDGWLDLYVINHFNIYDTVGKPLIKRDYLFFNNGGNPVTFTNASSMISGDNDADGTPDNEGFGFAASFTDWDMDGDMDIYVINDCRLVTFATEDNKLWDNINGELIEISDQIGPFIDGKKPDLEDEIIPDCQNGMGLAIGDVDRNGYFDYYYTNLDDGEGNQSAVIVMNNGKNLINRTRQVGLFDAKSPDGRTGRVTWGAEFLDYDLDGWEDLMVAAGRIIGLDHNQPNLLYHNNGVEADTLFTKISDTESGIESPFKGRTLITGDYDNDGDPDAFLVNYAGLSELYQNNYNGNNNWLIVDLQGAGPPLSNMDGIGAKLFLTMTDGGTQLKEIHSGTSLGGGSDIVAHFGLGQEGIELLEIHWPSGVVQLLNNVPVNQRIMVAEDEEFVPVTSVGRIDVSEQIKVYPNPTSNMLTIELENDYTGQFLIKILSSKGQLIKLIKAKKRTSMFNATIDINNLEVGTYLIRLSFGKTEITKRVILD